MAGKTSKFAANGGVYGFLIFVKKPQTLPGDPK